MGRTIVWIGLGLGLAGLMAFALLDRSEVGPTAADLTIDDDPLVDPRHRAGPGLRGGGREHAARPGAARGAYRIHGRVVDPEGQPAGDVPVVARRTGPAWNPGDATTPGNRVAAVVERALAALDDPVGAQPTLAAQTRTDAEGTFELGVAQAARYEVHARPSAPLVGTQGSVSVHAKAPEAETTLHLLPGSPLRGRVLDTVGEPVAVHLKARWWSFQTGRNRTWSSPLLTTDAATGRFTIPAVPAGAVRFALYLPGGRSVTGQKVTTPTGEEVILRVPAGEASVAGTVADADGKPVPGARVVIGIGIGEPNASGITSAKTIADGAGRYRIEAVPAGRVASAQALATGFLPLHQSPRDAPWAGAETTAGETLTLDLTLHRGGRVHGRVLVHGRDRPIADARVRLVPARQGAANAQGDRRITTTDADGRYAFEGVAVGRYAALPDHPDYYLPALAGDPSALIRTASQGRAAPADLTVVITKDGAEVERNLALAPGLTVGGRVVGPGGEPAADATIHARGFGLARVAWAWGLGGIGTEPLATSGADGRFGIKGLPARPDWVLYAKKKGAVGSFSEAFALAPDVPAPSVELRLLAGATVRGRVVGLEGSSLEGAQVGLWGQQGELSSASTMKPVEPDGVFEFTGVPPGMWTVNVWVGGRPGAQQVLADLKSGEVREGIELAIAAGVEVSGVVVDEQGRGVSGVNLLLQSRGGGVSVHTQTGEGGAFEFSGADAGPAQLMVWNNQVSSALGPPFEAPRTGLRLVYEPDPVVTITGRVLDPAGAPVPLALVKITSYVRSGRNPGPSYFGRENGEEVVGGRFRQQVTGPSPYKVSVTQPRDADGRALNLQPAQQKITDATQPVIVRLEGGLEIAGRVLDLDGRPLADVTVTAANRSARTDATGRFQVGGLQPGTVHVQVTPPEGFVRPAGQPVRAGRDDLEFRLLPGLEIRGQALAEDGKPLTEGIASAAWKQAGSVPAGGCNARLGAQGAFALKGIPAAVRVTVKVQQWTTGRGVAHAPAIVEGVHPGTHDLVVRLGAGVSIQGVLLGADGRPTSGCFVYAASVNEGGYRTGWLQPDAEGAFTLSGLTPGRYRVRVQRQDGGAAPDPVEVDAPANAVRIRLPKSVALGGRVVGLEGDPDVVRWRVRAWAPDGRKVGETRLGADGTWRLPAVREAAAYTVGALYWKDGRYALEESVRQGAVNVVLRLRTGKPITGVVDRAGLDPAMGYSIVARGAPWQAPGRVDKETGRFEINGLPPGRYTLMARANDGSASGTLENVEAGAENVRLPVRAR